MARMTPSARRDAIVDAALQVANRKGLGATTVRDVAAELGCSSGLIHHYFDSMDDVLAEAFDRVAGRDLAVTEQAVAEQATPVDQLAAFFDSYGRTDEASSFQLWLDAWAEAARRPALGATSRRLNVAWQRLLATIVERGVAERVFRCDDPDGAAWRIVSMVDGLALQNVAHGPLLPPNAIMDWAYATTERELDLPAGSLTRPLVGARTTETGSASATTAGRSASRSLSRTPSRSPSRSSIAPETA